MKKPSLSKFYRWLVAAVDELNQGVDPYEVSVDHLHFLFMYNKNSMKKVSESEILLLVPRILRIASPYIENKLQRNDLVFSINCTFTELEEDSTVPVFSNVNDIGVLLWDTFNVSSRFCYRDQYLSYTPFYKTLFTRMPTPSWADNDTMMIYSKSYLNSELITHGIEFCFEKDADYFPWKIGEIVEYEAMQIENSEH